VTVTEVERPTPLAFGLVVDRAREQVSSEKFLDRVRRLVAPLERAADRNHGRIRFGSGRGRGFR
jgi:ATP-dependent Lhr-like helicase